MPPRSIKVVKLSSPETEAKEAEPSEPIVQEPEQTVEEKVPEEIHEQQPEQQSDDVMSEDLDALVKEYSRARKQKLKDQDVKSECQHCGKLMSAKSLKYSHKKNCKEDPSNKPPPTPPPSPPPSPITRKRSSAPRTRRKAHVSE